MGTGEDGEDGEVIFLMPNAQCPMPNAPCPITNHQSPNFVSYVTI
jgi:hypothetical protein